MNWTQRILRLAQQHDIPYLRKWAKRRLLKRVPPEKILALYHKQKKTLHQESA